jgi:uncharacterized protein (TIGR00369 family)
MNDSAAPRFVDRPEDLPDVQTFAALSGLEIMRRVLSGGFPAPPITRTMGFHLAEVEEGRVVFEGTPGFSHYNVLGGVHGGWFGVLLDSCMGCAVHSRLPAGKGYTTLEYKVNVIRPAGEGTGLLRAIGATTHVGRRTGIAEGRLVDAEGKLYALGTTTCLIFDF